MPWFKVDDTLAFHAKTVAAGNSAMGLWVRAGSWSMQTLSDGFIPAHIVRQLGRTADAKKLCESGLWVEDEGGYLFHEWEQRQPSKAKVHADRKANADRLHRWREDRKKKGETDV